MPDDPNPIPAGSTGTVVGTPYFINGSWQVMVDWDSKDRSLSLVVPPDVALRI
jgi:hypothetical protein